MATSSAPPPELTNPELEARIMADPDDLSAYLVYSDWLGERGDPRGELIAVQAKLKEEPGKKELVDQEAKLLITHRKTWLGDLFEHEAPKDLAFTWRLGFIDSVRIGPPLKDYETSELDFAELIAGLMKTVPHVNLVREIIVGSKSADDWPSEWNAEVEALVENKVPAALTRLVFDAGGYWDISSTSLGDLSRLYPTLRETTKLRELRIRMGAMDLGSAMDLPSLRSLEIVTGGLTTENVASIAASSWPNLERLSLCIGETDNDYGCNVHYEHLANLLDASASNFPKLRHLGLKNSSLADEIAESLPQAKLLAQLETLDLSFGTFSGRGARALVGSASSFKHLKEIDLTHHYVPEEMHAELAKALSTTRIVLADQQAEDEDGEDAYRYVRIGE